MTLACVGAADAIQPLEQHVYAALNSGDITITEMREAVLHFAVYAGWPKASRFNIAVDQQWDAIMAERGEQPPAPEPLLPLVTESDPEQRLRGGEQSFKEIDCIPFAPTRDNPYSGAGILNFVFGEMWLRPGLGMKERRLITVACVAFQDAEGSSCYQPGVRGQQEERRCFIRGDGRTGAPLRGVLRLRQGGTTSTR